VDAHRLPQRLRGRAAGGGDGAVIDGDAVINVET
jgi:hypothetical protein